MSLSRPLTTAAISNSNDIPEVCFSIASSRVPNVLSAPALTIF